MHISSACLEGKKKSRAHTDAMNTARPIKMATVKEKETSSEDIMQTHHLISVSSYVSTYFSALIGWQNTNAHKT